MLPPDPASLGSVGGRLLYARRCAKLTRDDVRKYSRIPILTLQSYETGKRAIPLERVRLLARRYRVAVKWVTGGEGEAPRWEEPVKLTDLQRIMRCL